MIQTFVIPGRLDGLNEYTAQNRGNRCCGNACKRRNEKLVRAAIRAACLEPMRTPVRITAHWHEGRKPGSRQFRALDRDNIRFAMKFIQDALVAEGIIDDDAFDKVDPRDTYTKDRDDPHVVVVIEEVR